MRFVLKKLKSSGGASMLMALLLLLIVAMVSSVVISAAASSVFNLSTAQAQQQAYLTTLSPAKLMRETVRSNQWSYKKVIKGAEYSFNDRDWSFTQEDSTVTKPGKDVIFGKFIGDAVESVVEYNIPYTQSYTISVPGYDDVSAELTFAPLVEDETGHLFYQLRAVLSLASDIEQNSEKSAPFRLVYTIRASINEDRKVGSEYWINAFEKKRAVELTQQLVWDTETDKIEKG